MALKGRRFDTRESIIADSKKVLKNIPKDAISKCFKSWEKRWKLCIDLEGGTNMRGAELMCEGRGLDDSSLHYGVDLAEEVDDHHYGSNLYFYIENDQEKVSINKRETWRTTIMLMTYLIDYILVLLTETGLWEVPVVVFFTFHPTAFQLQHHNTKW
ncbi:hypothetical protein LAZ67_14001667 [Cordylochernes scorpioides]|uniref:Uncharacterized protein n=1 Tax=Cordylochernes scorpioides TaxID=51811 RepID=A0ABY6L677_9ARAC|nr:hypothetical protein LAZ67_14001667 [Cordylochernes scorpioides]